MDNNASRKQLCLPVPGRGGGRLSACLGAASVGAPGKENADFYGVHAPGDAEEQARGLVLALADGVSAGSGGRMAAEVAVLAITTDYFTTRPDWPMAQALDRVLQAANGWLAAEGARRPDLQGTVAAVSGLILLDDSFHIAHVGDTRIYLRRGSVLRQLTADHSWPRRDMRHVLRRAVGLDSHLVVDFSRGELLPGDRFLLVSDGVWDVLGEQALDEAARGAKDAQETAAALAEASRARQATYHGRNDASALVVDILPRA